MKAIFAWCRMPDVHDPEAYLAGATAILAQYPPEVMAALADPVSGTRHMKDFPTLRDLRVACDVLFEPIEREIERRRAEEQHRLGLPAPRRRTPEEQARIDAQVRAWRRSQGIPDEGLSRRRTALVEGGRHG